MTLYELLTGRLPINGATNYEIMMGHMEQTPVPPHQLVPQIPLVLSSAVMRALEKDPAQRFLSADEFLHVLRLVPITDESCAPDGTQLTLPIAHSARPAASSGATRPAPVVSGRMSGSSDFQASSGSGFQSLPLEDVSRKLAVYIGPVAKFVVKKLAAQYDDVDTIYREAAKEIESDTDRAAFLRSKKQ